MFDRQETIIYYRCRVNGLESFLPWRGSPEVRGIPTKEPQNQSPLNFFKFPQYSVEIYRVYFFILV